MSFTFWSSVFTKRVVLEAETPSFTTCSEVAQKRLANGMWILHHFSTCNTRRWFLQLTWDSFHGLPNERRVCAGFGSVHETFTQSVHTQTIQPDQIPVLKPDLIPSRTFIQYMTVVWGLPVFNKNAQIHPHTDTWTHSQDPLAPKKKDSTYILAWVQSLYDFVFSTVHKRRSFNE